jgi:hypothetical protein
MSNFDLSSLAYEALDAFGEVIAKRFPQALSGDLSPQRTFALHEAAMDAIAEWIENNVPESDRPSLPHNRKGG